MDKRATSNLAVAVSLTAAALMTPCVAAADSVWTWNDANRNALSNSNARITQSNVRTDDSSKEIVVSYQHYKSGNERGTVVLVTNQKLSGTATEAKLTYSVYFPKSFKWGAVDGSYPTQGAKFMGLGPSQPLTGCATSTSPDRWSVRVGWEPASTTTVKPRLYYYPFNRTSECGMKSETTAAAFEHDRWYNIQLRVILGATAGKDTALLFVNGVEVSRVQNIMLRGPGFTNASKIATFMFNTLIGSSRSASDTKIGSPYSLYMDSINVERLKN